MCLWMSSLGSNAARPSSHEQEPKYENSKQGLEMWFSMPFSPSLHGHCFLISEAGQIPFSIFMSLITTIIITLANCLL